jgi:hypothetical protein
MWISRSDTIDPLPPNTDSAGWSAAPWTTVAGPLPTMLTSLVPK